MCREIVEDRGASGLPLCFLSSPPILAIECFDAFEVLPKVFVAIVHLN